MNDANAVFLDSELLKDAEATNQRPALSPNGDELKTMQLPPLSPPPPKTAPLPVAFPPPAPAPFLAVNIATTRYPSQPPPMGRPSWLRALLTTAFPAQADDRGSSQGSLPVASLGTDTAGVAFAVLGLVFAIVALVMGLRGPPTDASIAPVVAAALVLAHALVALGAGALSFAMFLRAERLLVRR